MFVYCHWNKSGGCQCLQAFHKLEKAAEFVIDQMEANLAEESRNYGAQSSKKKKGVLARGPAPGLNFPGEIAQPLPPEPNLFNPVNNAAVQWNGDLGAWNPPFAQVVPNNLFDQLAIQRVKPAAQIKAEMVLPDELEKLRLHLELAKKDKTIDNAMLAIKLYEDFLKYVQNSESPLHTLTDLKVAE